MPVVSFVSNSRTTINGISLTLITTHRVALLDSSTPTVSLDKRLPHNIDVHLAPSEFRISLTGTVNRKQVSRLQVHRAATTERFVERLDHNCERLGFERAYMQLGSRRSRSTRGKTQTAWSGLKKFCSSV
jgi:hypothetical protein